MAAYDATGFLPRILERLSSRYGGNVVGALLIVVSSFTLAAMLASAKDLSASYSVWQIVLMFVRGRRDAYPSNRSQRRQCPEIRTVWLASASRLFRVRRHNVHVLFGRLFATGGSERDQFLSDDLRGCLSRHLFL